MTIVSDTHRFVHIKINKTAGSSVHAAMAPYGDRAGLPMHLPVCSRRIWKPRQRALASRVEGKVLRDYFVFTFVRNPWDRVVSHFYQRHPRWAGLPPEAAVPAFARWVAGTYGRLLAARPQARGVPRYPLLFSPQVAWITDAKGETVVDWIGRFERLAGDFASLCGRLGLPPRPLPHEKRTARRLPYPRYYDTTTRRVVTSFFREDIERFDYRFDP